MAPGSRTSKARQNVSMCVAASTSHLSSCGSAGSRNGNPYEVRLLRSDGGDIGTRGAMEVLDLLAMSIFMWLSIATHVNLRLFTIIQDLWTSEQRCLP
jgi:hypothetical protein